jgi:hypothetical protein
MPFELSEYLKNTCGLTFASKGLNVIFCNKFYTTIILTIIILMIITIMYPCKKGTPFWVVGKVGLYIFMATITILFIHGSVTHSTNALALGGADEDDFVANINGGNNIAFDGDNMHIKPKFGGNYAVIDGDENEASGGSDELFKMFGV